MRQTNSTWQQHAVRMWNSTQHQPADFTSLLLSIFLNMISAMEGGNVSSFFSLALALKEVAGNFFDSVSSRSSANMHESHFKILCGVIDTLISYSCCPLFLHPKSLDTWEISLIHFASATDLHMSLHGMSETASNLYKFEPATITLQTCRTKFLRYATFVNKSRPFQACDLPL